MIRTGVAAAACLSILFSLWSIRQENLVRQSQQRYEQQTRRLEHDPGALRYDTPTAPPPTGVPARYLLTDALYLARLAAPMEKSDLRSDLLLRAGDEARQASQARANWGEAQLAMAYIGSLTSSHFGDDERYALIQSYIDAPFIHDAGLWRIARSLPHWDALPRSTRYRLERETVWFLCKSSYPVRRQLFTMVRQSSGYVPIFIAYGQAGCPA